MNIKKKKLTPNCLCQDSLVTCVGVQQSFFYYVSFKVVELSV